MSIAREPKQRKHKVHKAQTYSARRNADRALRTRKRAHTERRERMRRHYKFKVRVVRYYRLLREQVSERQAAERTLARWQPVRAWHFPTSWIVWACRSSRMRSKTTEWVTQVIQQTLLRCDQPDQIVSDTRHILPLLLHPSIPGQLSIGSVE